MWLNILIVILALFVGLGAKYFWSKNQEAQKVEIIAEDVIKDASGVTIDFGAPDNSDQSK